MFPPRAESVDSERGALMSIVTPMPPPKAAPLKRLRCFHDLEPKICDLVRLAEMALDLSLVVINESDSRGASHAALMVEIVHERTEQLKADYYAAHKDGE
jgi:hypothetical protein